MILKSRWYIVERMTVPVLHVRADLGAFKTQSEAVSHISASGQDCCTGKHILEYPKRFLLKRALSVHGCDTLDQSWIDNNVDWKRAALTYSAYPRQRPSVLVDYVPEYEWAWDKVMGDVWAHVWIDVRQMTPSEGDWDAAMQYESTLQYAQWYKDGHMPPPLFVVRHTDGHLVSLNRRRWLAAREAGVESLPCWYSPTDLKTGKPIWERRICIYNRTKICIVYRSGGDCTTCDWRKKNVNVC